jgi:hypothetical protein
VQFQHEIGGFVFRDMHFSLPAYFAPAAISKIPTEELGDYNGNIIDNKILAPRYEIIEDRYSQSPFSF